MVPTDATAIVAEIKQQLEARGVSLLGPCGAFEITKRVAWRLRDVEAGLLQKSTGNACEGFAVDIIAFPDGSIVDCLVNAENENRPAWNPNGAVDPARWRPAIDPGDGEAPVPIPVPPSPGPVEPELDLSALFELVANLTEQIVISNGAILELSKRVETLNARGLKIRL